MRVRTKYGDEIRADESALLGMGAEGMVLRAKLRNGRVVAFKIFTYEKPGAQQQIEWLRGKTAGWNAPPLFAFPFDMTDAPMGIVTPLVSGGDGLSAYLSDVPSFSPVRIAIAMQLARAFDVLRSRGIFFNDWHPGNVLVVERQSRFPHVILIDFQCAFGPGAPPAMGGGTDLTIAPEVEQTGYTPAADIYAFAVLLHWVLLGFWPVQTDVDNALDYELIRQRKLQGWLYDKSSGGGLLAFLRPRPPYGSVAPSMLSDQLKGFFSSALSPNPVARQASSPVSGMLASMVRTFSLAICQKCLTTFSLHSLTSRACPHCGFDMTLSVSFHGRRLTELSEQQTGWVFGRDDFQDSPHKGRISRNHMEIQRHAMVALVLRQFGENGSYVITQKHPRQPRFVPSGTEYLLEPGDQVFVHPDVDPIVVISPSIV
ncbi:protein kinase domain-containing protein [Limnohabitans radicicola]|uniref:FHA domain-containing protein n=1 Tax=Limnohabitans radicicola TaxID=2771427 RepID=A0A927FK88_9BURK|nr:FHA domain-containing protein [Limnohabitans radicicola]MBD8051977.1 FHA domain-containing protein [Limnohabitans radicicola]